MSARSQPKRTTTRVLVVDDETIIRETLCEYLQQEGYSVIPCGSGEDALEWISRQEVDVALCDVNLPGIDGIQVLEQIQKRSPETLVILITAYATVETAIEAFQKGVHDYLMKPILLHEVHEKIRRLLKFKTLNQENQWLRRELNREMQSSEMVVGQSLPMKDVMRVIERVAPTNSTLLILGESGTGKELLARKVHQLAQNARPTDGLFVAVNCAAIPAELIENQLFGHKRGGFTGADKDATGLFVHAGNGTVFLDEIGELPLMTQAKLLRAIEQKEVLPVGANEPVKVQARILAATNKDLTKDVQNGLFRQDLFYRLNVVSVTLPALRERPEDLPEFIDFLLAKHCRSMGKSFLGFSREAMQLLMAHTWSGNIRELDNAIQRAVILGEPPFLQVGDLPPSVTPQADDPFSAEELDEAMKRFEKLHIERILGKFPDKREAAKKLNIGLSSLYRKIEQLKITIADAD